MEKLKRQENLLAGIFAVLIIALGVYYAASNPSEVKAVTYFPSSSGKRIKNYLKDHTFPGLDWQIYEPQDGRPLADQMKLTDSGRIKELCQNNKPDIVLDMSGFMAILNKQPPEEVVAGRRHNILSIRQQCGANLPVITAVLTPHLPDPYQRDVVEATAVDAQEYGYCLIDPLDPRYRLVTKDGQQDLKYYEEDEIHLNFAGIEALWGPNISAIIETARTGKCAEMVDPQKILEELRKN